MLQTTAMYFRHQQYLDRKEVPKQTQQQQSQNDKKTQNNQEIMQNTNSKNYKLDWDIIEIKKHMRTRS